MARQAGIPLLNLFDTVEQITQSLPEPIASFLGKFVALDLESRTSDGAVIHTGKIQSLDVVLADSDIQDFDLGFGKLRIPGVTTVLPFQFSKRRNTNFTDDLEPAEDSWQFDLFLDDFSLVFDGLVAARLIKEVDTTPRHLEALPGKQPVAFTGSAALRIERVSSAAQPTFRFIDPIAGSDPFLPNALSGGVAHITCTPPHFLCGKSGVGFTIRDIMFDGSKRYSPPFVIEQGQSANWTGFALKEATVYTAPALGLATLSATLRDFLIGDPAGLQARIEFQMGRSPLDSATFVFNQAGNELGGFDKEAGTLKITAQPGEEVLLEASLTVDDPSSGDPDGITDYKAEYKFPNQAAIVADSASGMVSHGDIVEITSIEVIGPDDVEIRKPPFTIRMIAEGSDTAPELSSNVIGPDLAGIVDISGPAAKLDGMVLNAADVPPDSAAEFHFRSEALGIDSVGTSLTLAIPSHARGTHFIEITQKDAVDRAATKLRLKLRENDEDEVLVGTPAGVFGDIDPSTAKNISQVLGTYDLADFHTKGRLSGGAGDATRSGSTVSVPAGMIAEVAVDQLEAALPAPDSRHIQVLFQFDSDQPVGWGPEEPADAGSDIAAAVLKWAEEFPGASFQIIGRCDDVGSDSYNIDLAQHRADAAAALLPQGSTIQAIGEQSIVSLLPGAAALIEPDIDEQSHRLIDANGTSAPWPKDGNDNGLRTAPPDPSRESERLKYRRADIYAIGGTSAPQQISPSLVTEPDRRRILVPSTGRKTAPSANGNAKADYRLKAVIGWDRARFTGWGDMVPNIAEVEYAWTPSDDGITLTAQTLMAYGKWIYDDLTGFTEFTIGLESQGDEDGLASTTDTKLVSAFAFGPMLTPVLNSQTDMLPGDVGAASLLAMVGAGAIGTINTGTGPLVAGGSKTALIGVESKTTTRTLQDPFASMKTQLTVDYTNTVNIDAGALGLKTKEPMKLRYDDVGIIFDNTDPDAALNKKVGLVFASDAMSIEDSGLWEIKPPIGTLLSVRSFRMGVGSLWIEPSLSLALNLGVVEVSEATFRVTFEKDSAGKFILPPKFSLRGFTASVDIPNALRGEGRLKIEESGLVKAAIDVTVLPLQVRAVAALAVGKPPEVAPSLFMNLYAKVQFPGGIPLGPLPLAIQGFIGQTVINGERDIDNTTDIVTREIGWWGTPPELKYRPERGQHALGVGVVIGTLPDASFCLSAEGMVVVAFPDPEVILGVEVDLLSVPSSAATDEKASGSSAAITGLVVINPQAVSLAVSADYEIPKILELKVPFSAYFPAPSTGHNTYIRLGSDGHADRPGEPITITLLPDTLDLRAWSFLMIEGGGIQDLGGEADWDFDGFAVGFGAGIGLEWKAGPIGLSASAKMLVGLGTDPLIIKGGLWVDGKLDLVVVSIAARGDIVLTYTDMPNASPTLSLEGEFCGEVDMWFFSLKGCVDFSIGPDVNMPVPAAPSPVKSIALTDRMGTTMGEAVNNQSDLKSGKLFDFVNNNGVMQNEGVDAEDNHRVWPDTVPVINFGHFIKDGLGTGQFDPSAQPSGEPWFGSSRLKYAYKLTNVVLTNLTTGIQVSDPSGDSLQSAWTHSPSRAADDTSGSGAAVPSGAEATSLQLLNWEPWAWARSTADGGEGQPGDPVDTIGRICEPVPPPARACLLGSAADILSPTDARLRRNQPAPGPYPSKFRGTGRSVAVHNNIVHTGSQLTALLTSRGINMRGGEMVPTPAILAGGHSHSQAYRLPAGQRVTPEGSSPVALSWRADLDRDVTDGELTLLVCQDDSDHSPGGGEHCYDFADSQIGTVNERLAFPSFIATASDTRKPLEITDRLDISRPSGPQRGSDEQGELTIHHPGAKLDFVKHCKELELHIFRQATGKLTLVIHHADGSVSEQTADGPPSAAILVALSSESGIAAVLIKFPGKFIHLYRVCCKPSGDPRPPVDGKCLNISGLPASIEGKRGFEHEGAVFKATGNSGSFARTDAIDSGSEPARRGQDGRWELQIPYDGMSIDLPFGCTHLEIGIMQFAGPVTARGLNADGKVVAEASAAQVQAIGLTLTLRATEEIVRVELAGGDGEALLYRLCCMSDDDLPGSDKHCIDLSDLPRAFDGRKSASIEDLRIAPLHGQPIGLTDMVDTSGAPQAGSDKQAELLINRNGLRLDWPRGCADLELHIIQAHRQPVLAKGFDAKGNLIARGASDPRQRGPQIIALQAETPIERLELSGGGNESALFRLCCAAGAATTQGERCIAFKRRPGDQRKLAKLAQEGVIFTDPGGRKSLHISDRLTVDEKQIKAGPDGVNELIFGEGGLNIALPAPARRVSLLLAVPKGVEYAIEALGERRKRIAGEGGQSIGKPMSITLEGEGIAQVVIRAPSQGILARICIDERTGSPGHHAPTMLGHSDPAEQNAISLPVVTAEDVDEAATGSGSNWPGTVIREFRHENGHRCAVVRYVMPEGAKPFDRVTVTPQTEQQDIALLSLCGVDNRAAKWRARDVDVRSDLAADLANDPNGDGRPVLLDPDCEYRIDIEYEWQAWQGQDDADNAPATPIDSNFGNRTSDSFFFTTASETVLPTVPDGPVIQDGPNECIFDPRDVDRYLLGSDPANAAIAHFTDDPVVFYFSQAHIGNLLEVYGRELSIEVRRTDPPPQPGGDISALIAPLPGVVSKVGLPQELQSDFDQRIDVAIKAAPCLAGVDPIAGGTAMAGTYPLEPKVMYDCDLMARVSADHTDKLRVQASRFTTSRYANPREMVEAIGMGTGSQASPAPPLELVIEQGKSVPANIMGPSDRDFDIAMADMGLETLGLPDGQPRLFQIWQPDTAGGAMHMVALLVDALEPLDRKAAIVQGDIEWVDRCRLSHAVVDGRRFEVVRRTRNSTRALLAAPASFSSPTNGDSFELHFDTNNGPVIGRQHLRSVPLVMEIEGF
ncbi:MAG: hypothetical protein ABJM58_03700 [Alteripontixanthobacter sp.]